MSHELMPRGNHWDPFAADFPSVQSILKEANELFERALTGRKSGGPAFLAPRIEVLDRKDSVVIRAEVPGMEKKDIQLSMEDGSLVIRGETKREHENEKDGVLYSERSYGSFYRSVALPAEVDENNVKASYKDGVLSVTLQKSKKAEEKAKTIAIE